MFFPERITSINLNDKVLEIGPGGSPYHRSDTFLELRFESETEAYGQRGYTDPIKTDKKIVYYDGGKFPFATNEYDYVICSHVLEHIEDVPFFISELQRVASKGYLEFPTIYYDFIYDFPEHITFVLYKEDSGKLYFMPKSESELSHFTPVTQFFYATAKAGYHSLINELKPYLFQGFEWSTPLDTIKASSLKEVTFDLNMLTIPPKKNTHDQRKSLISKISQFINK